MNPLPTLLRPLATCAFLTLALGSPTLAAEEFRPLDAALSSYSYPFEVKIRSFQDQRIPLEMAYMDVRPATPNGRTVLLLHGKNFSGAYWGPTAQALADQGYRVVIPDQIGFGKSSKPERYQYSLQALAVHNHGLLNELGIGKAVVVGHSMGGMLAARLALADPGTVEKLVLVNPIGLEDWQRMVPYQPVEAGYRSELAKTPEKIREYMKGFYFDGVWKSEYDPLLELQAGWAVGPDREKIAWVAALTADMIFTQPVIQEFPALRVPTLLIIGERDRTAIGKERAAPEIGKAMGQYQDLGKAAAAAIPGARLVALPGIGHVPQYESYAAYWRALDGFLRE